MNNISFINFNTNTKYNKNLQTQRTTSPIKDTYNLPKMNSQVKDDTVELSTVQTKKPIDKKKAVIIGGAIIGLAVAGGIAIVKAKNTTKIKKEITELYDKVFDCVAEDAKKNGLNFEKPKLLFENLDNTTGACYRYTDNTVTYNTKLFKRKLFIKKDLSQLNSFDGKKLNLNTIFTAQTKDELQKANLDSMFREATKGEIKAQNGSVLYHELTHAKQFQYGLSTTGGKEKIIENIKKNHPNLSDEDIKKTFPFLFSYKPNKLYESTAVFSECAPEGNKFSKFAYNLNSIVNAFTNYTSGTKNQAKYFLNTTEISARNGEASYWEKLLNGSLPKPEGIDEAEIKNIRKAYANNVDILLGSRQYMQQKRA